MAQEPNWDKIKVEKNLNIILGRSQNQALKVLCRVKPFPHEFESKYKEVVRKLFKYNCELQEELIEFNIVKEENVAASKLKQKNCPKCDDLIPVGFQFHQKCGWKGQ